MYNLHGALFTTTVYVVMVVVSWAVTVNVTVVFPTERDISDDWVPDVIAVAPILIDANAWVEDGVKRTVVWVFDKDK